MLRISLLTIVFAVSAASFGVAQPPPAPKKAPQDPDRIELRMVELRPIEGVTEPEGFTYNEQGGLAYFHKEPALVIKPSDVDQIVVRKNTSPQGLFPPDFSVKIHLTDNARKQIAAKAADGDGMRFIVGYFGNKQSTILFRYEIKETSGVPDNNQAKSFIPLLSFSNSAVRVEDVVKALMND